MICSQKYFHFFLSNSFTYLCAHVDTGAHLHVRRRVSEQARATGQEVRAPPTGSVLLFYHVALGRNPGHRAWSQAPVPAEPSCWPHKIPLLQRLDSKCLRVSRANRYLLAQLQIPTSWGADCDINWDLKMSIFFDSPCPKSPVLNKTESASSWTAWC